MVVFVVVGVVVVVVVVLLVVVLLVVGAVAVSVIPRARIKDKRSPATRESKMSFLYFRNH